MRWPKPFNPVKFGLVITVLALFWCEYLVYYVTIMKCSWPSLTVKQAREHPEPLRAFFIADTHLLGPYRGHWLDKLRREWQMRRAYASAVFLNQPDVVFFLGDLFDEGHWVDDEGFQVYMDRFHQLFPASHKTKIYVVPGNHDMGFHYALTSRNEARFSKAFSSKSIQLVQIQGIDFVLVNSMAMHQDGCSLCHGAEMRLKNLAARFQCQRNPSSKKLCAKYQSDHQNVTPTAPVLLQHFPLYRVNDQLCEGPDTASFHEKMKVFRESWECISKGATDLLLESLVPRLVLSGHTHHGCQKRHVVERYNYSVTEHSVPSFSWRNRNNPSFFMGVFTPSGYSLRKCFLPEELEIVYTYCFAYFAVFVNCFSIILRRIYLKQKVV